MRIVPAMVTVLLLLCSCSRTAVTGDTSTGVSTRASGTTSATATAEQAARGLTVLDRAIKKSKPGCSAAVGIAGKVVWAADQPQNPKTPFNSDPAGDRQHPGIDKPR